MRRANKINTADNTVKEIKYFTERELNALFKAIEKDDSKYSTRNEAIFKIAYYCAFRASEIANIMLDDFNLLKNEIYCKRLKGSNNNTLRIVDNDILRSLKRHIRNISEDSQYIFLSQKKQPISRKTLDLLMKHYCSIAKIKDKSKWHFHTLKHTRAVNLAEAGLDLKDIQYWLGHVEIANTLVYFQYTSSQQEHLYKKIAKY